MAPTAEETTGPLLEPELELEPPETEPRAEDTAAGETLMAEAIEPTAAEIAAGSTAVPDATADETAVGSAEIAEAM